MTNIEPKAAQVNGRDVYEVANQLGSYVGPDTDERLAQFLIRESEAAAYLADEIVRLRSVLAHPELEALEAAFRAGFDAGYANGKFDDTTEDDAWQNFLANSDKGFEP